MANLLRRSPVGKLGPIGLAMLLAESATLIRRHWGRLAPHEQREFRRLVAQAKGRPSNLAPSDRAEMQRLIGLLDLGVFGREMVRVLSPVRGFGRRRR